MGAGAPAPPARQAPFWPQASGRGAGGRHGGPRAGGCCVSCPISRARPAGLWGLFTVPMAAAISAITWGPGRATVPAGPGGGGFPKVCAQGGIGQHGVGQGRPPLGAWMDSGAETQAPGQGPPPPWAAQGVKTAQTSLPGATCAECDRSPAAHPADHGPPWAGPGQAPGGVTPALEGHCSGDPVTHPLSPHPEVTRLPGVLRAMGRAPRKAGQPGRGGRRPSASGRWEGVPQGCAQGSPQQKLPRPGQSGAGEEAGVPWTSPCLLWVPPCVPAPTRRLRPGTPPPSGRAQAAPGFVPILPDGAMPGRRGHQAAQARADPGARPGVGAQGPWTAASLRPDPWTGLGAPRGAAWCR